MKLRFTRNPHKSGGHVRPEGTPVKVYRFMRENRGRYTIREKDGSIWGIK